jgi:O-succinylbenzoic acid--CoA ligase
MAGILSGVDLASLSGVSSLWPVSGDAEEILALLRDWDAAPEPEPLVIETSGSTGQPKRVQLSRDALRASVLATAVRLGGHGQWVLNLPPTYVAGVQVLYRSVLAGTEPVVLAPGDALGPVRDRMSAPRTYVSLVPTQLFRALGEDASVRALARFSTVLVGGGPLAPDVRAEAESRGIAIVQTYGMSETCGGCVYDGVPLDGVEVLIAEGEVLLRGPVLFDGYVADPERTAASFRDGWLVTNDLGHWAEDGRLRIDGRSDDMINSGGVKVPARAVATQLAGALAVRAIEIVGVPDPEWGERVVAVIATDHPPTLEQVRHLIEPRSWAPRQLVVVDEIPELSNGKTDRLAIQKLALGG